MLKIGSPVPHRHSRIEIIPLIDIMFFLLASFMMVSLQMSKTENRKVDPPPAITGKDDFQPGSINVAVDESGTLYVMKSNIAPVELSLLVSNSVRLNTNASVYISGDHRTPHGAMAGVYKLVRDAGVQRISLLVAAEESPKGRQGP